MSADKVDVDKIFARVKARHDSGADPEKNEADAADSKQRKKQKQVDILIQATKKAVELFHAPDGKVYADVVIGGHRETWPIRSRTFQRMVLRIFYEKMDSAPSAEVVRAACDLLEAKALFDGPERIVGVRVVGHGDIIYIDLADTDWRAVEISAYGWRIVDHPPVRFRRASGMRPLPAPQKGGSVTTLRQFLNVGSDANFVLAVSVLLAAMRPCGPYPVLALSGEQGSAKSTFARIFRALIDPNTAGLRALPREDRDLFIAANNGHVLAFDNVSGLPAWISDAICRIATGGGFATRALFTDSDEMLFDAMRPFVLNGIEDVVERPDLADRAVMLTLEQIPETKRRPEKELWAEFEREQPLILGALFDAVAHGLRMLPQTKLDTLPRLADFALWATACETSLWPAGTFLAAYTGNRDEAVDSVIDANPVALAVRAFMASRTDWTGTASGLLAELGDEKQRKAKLWPDSPRALSGQLRRAATPLRKVGVDIVFGREGHSRTRTIRISINPSPSPPGKGLSPSAPAGPSAPHRDNGLSRPVGADGAAGIVRSPARSSARKPLQNAAFSNADGADAKSRASSVRGSDKQPDKSARSPDEDPPAAVSTPADPPFPRVKAVPAQIDPGDDIPAFLRRCVQCSALSDDRGAVTACQLGGQLLWLHKECHRFLAQRPATAQETIDRVRQ